MVRRLRRILEDLEHKADETAVLTEEFTRVFTEICRVLEERNALVREAHRALKDEEQRRIVQ